MAQLRALLDGLPAFVINLDHRTDRWEALQASFEGLPLTRLSATGDEEKGWLGCTHSHIRACKQGIKSGARAFLVLEDDAMLVEGFTGWAALGELLRGDEWDVICLGGTVDKEVRFRGPKKEYRGVQRLKGCVAYIVRTAYAPNLVELWTQCLEEGRAAVLEDPDKKTTYGLFACDKWWWRLQARDAWFLAWPRLVMQRPSYSDIVGDFADYSKF